MATDTRHFIIDWLLRVPEGMAGEEARQFAFFRLGYFIASGSHASWAVLFALNGVAFMAWYNVVVALLFLGGGLVWRRFGNPLWLFGPLWLFEIPLHALLATVYGGLETLFWTIPLGTAVACLINANFSWSKRVLLAALATLSSCAAALPAFFIPPLSPLTAASDVYLFVTNFGALMGGLVLYVGLNQFQVLLAEKRLTREFNRAEGLLRNILPGPIALRLKDGERVIANEHKEVSVIFADIVDFTRATAGLTPGDLVETLNLVFSAFDTLAERHGAEKIKTIGDAYMVVLGVPDAQSNHAERAVMLALDMHKAIDDLSGRTHFEVRLRIGVNSGPVVAGVIGKRKFAYDLWGDAVNVAARMESHGAPGQILTTQATADKLPTRFAVRSEGMRDIKGKGPTQVFSVTDAS